MVLLGTLVTVAVFLVKSGVLVVGACVVLLRELLETPVIAVSTVVSALCPFIGSLDSVGPSARKNNNSNKE